MYFCVGNNGKFRAVGNDKFAAVHSNTFRVLGSQGIEVLSWPSAVPTELRDHLDVVPFLHIHKSFVYSPFPEALHPHSADHPWGIIFDFSQPNTDLIFHFISLMAYFYNNIIIYFTKKSTWWYDKQITEGDLAMVIIAIDDIVILDFNIERKQIKMEFFSCEHKKLSLFNFFLFRKSRVFIDHFGVSVPNYTYSMYPPLFFESPKTSVPLELGKN